MCSTNTAAVGNVAKPAITDAVITVLDGQGNNILYETYFGGSGYELVRWTAVDGNGNLYMVGTTTSTNFPRG